MIGRLAVASVIMAASPALAREDDIIVVTRGPDATSYYFSCVPSLVASNRSKFSIDYVQVDLEFSLRDGRTHRHEFKSSYRYGTPQPILPNVTRPLVIHRESQLMEAACADIVSIRVLDAICETGGKPCPTPISVKVDP